MNDMRSERGNQPGVTLVISALMCGGAERALTTMADTWIERGRPVCLITLFSRDLDFFHVDNRVQRVDLGLRPKELAGVRGIVPGLKLLFRLRRAIRAAGHPLVISFLTGTNLATLAVTRALPLKVIATEHTDPRSRAMGFLVEWPRRLLYRRADAVTVLTANVKEDWACRFLRPERVAVLPNPIAVPASAATDAALDLPDRYVVTMGRLIPDKGHRLLIEAFAAIAGRFPDVSLVILGEGPEREALEASVAERGLTGRVRLPGVARDTAPVLRSAECFVLSSRREGLPLALSEAMGLGVACVSFDCQSGPRELIHDGVDGILVPPGDREGLARAMADLLTDPARRTTLGSAAAQSVRERFGVEVIMDRWDAFLRGLESERT